MTAKPYRRQYNGHMTSRRHPNKVHRTEGEHLFEQQPKSPGVWLHRLQQGLQPAPSSLNRHPSNRTQTKCASRERTTGSNLLNGSLRTHNYCSVLNGTYGIRYQFKLMMKISQSNQKQTNEQVRCVPHTPSDGLKDMDSRPPTKSNTQAQNIHSENFNQFLNRQ